jgi:hypothetical protein
MRNAEKTGFFVGAGGWTPAVVQEAKYSPLTKTEAVYHAVGLVEDEFRWFFAFSIHIRSFVKCLSLVTTVQFSLFVGRL